MFYTGGAIHIILSVTQLAKVHDARIALYTVWQKSLANLLRTEFAKLSSRQTFLPYSSNNLHCAKHKQHAKHAETGAMPPEVHML